MIGLRERAWPRVSVIVCTYNDEAFIGECVGSLLAQNYPREALEIIVVDDGSTDGTPARVKEFTDILYLRQENRGPSTARNAGLLRSQGDIVCFTDSDCVAHPDWILKLVESHRSPLSPDTAAVGGRQLGHPEDPPLARKIDRFLAAVGIVGDYVKPNPTKSRVSHNASCNSSYQRPVILANGGFRDGMFPGEDVDLDRRLIRAGHSVMFTPEAVVYHHRPSSLGAFFRMLRRYGQSSADNVFIHGVFRLIQAFPFVLLATAILLLGAGTLTGRWGAPAGVSVGACLLASVYLWKKSRLDPGTLVLFETATVVLFTFGFFRRFLVNLIRAPYSMGPVLEPLRAPGGHIHDG